MNAMCNAVTNGVANVVTNGVGTTVQNQNQSQIQNQRFWCFSSRAVAPIPNSRYLGARLALGIGAIR